MDLKKHDELLNGKNANQIDSSYNNGQAQERILKNTSYLTIAFILQKILSFLYFVYIARYLGPVDLGLYDPVKSLIPIFLILIDFSLSVVLVREIARDPNKTESYLGSVLGIKLIFALVVVLSMGLYTNFSNYSNIVKTVLYLDAVIVALDTFTLTFFAVFRGLQNMKFEAMGMIGTQILTIIFGVLSISLNWGLQALFIAVAAGSIFNFVFSLTMLIKKAKIRVTLRWDMEIIKKFMKFALPFAIAAIFVKIYTYTDRFMLLKISGQSFVGWYVTAHKLTYALEFIPSAFAASIFPAMSYFFVHSRKDLAKTFEKAMHYLMVLSLPISIGIFVLADKIILTMYGDVYETSIQPLRILIMGLIVVFLNFPVGAFLNACNKQVVNTINMAIIVVINVIINIILIPKYSLNGAAVAALISGIVLFFLGLRWIGKIVEYDKKKLINYLLKIFCAAALMGIVLLLLKNDLSIFILMPLGAAVYFVLLYVFKGVNKNDIKTLYSSFANKFL
ncbi:MAG: flippase [Patescibacteria group bacterium]|jgi:O-antigen/teichoic acid export membrane protein